MPIDPGVLDSIATSNVKVMTELAVQNAISNQQNVNTIAQKALSKSLEAMDSTSVPEGLGIAAANRSDLSKQIADLAAAVSSMMASVKGGGNVPPVTP